MRRVAGTALTVASLFLGMVAVLINAPALFYMSFALISTLLACNLQSYLATKALRIERLAPKSVHVGELMTIEIVLWSERKIKRPLVTIIDPVPAKLASEETTPSLPVAPAYDLPVRTMYQVRASRRGLYRWKNLKLTATDALGLTTKTVTYQTEPTEVLVLPTAIPVMLDLPSSAAWGINEAISGMSAGAGIEPRGIRQYAYGDSLRHVHWRSSARTGTLQVKEFQAGSQGAAAFLIQTTKGTEYEGETMSSLDLMCGHAMYLCEQLLRQGIKVTFPLNEVEHRGGGEAERHEEVALLLARLAADRSESVAEDLLKAAEELPNQTTVYVFVSTHDPALAAALNQLRSNLTVIVLAYAIEEVLGLNQQRSALQFIDDYRRAGGLAVAMPGVNS